ncbi:MAG: hypothetical protein HOV86_35040 [Thermoactinospora sp.]|nr:hypothetical protein [Thermoactinospora sp.]
MTAHLAMPVGGIGTGTFAVCADGGLRQWQLANTGDHRGELPGTFFAVRAAQWEPPSNTTRILQGPPAEPTGTPLVNDDHVPGWQRELLRRFPGVAGTRFRGRYPFAELDFLDPGLPVEVGMEVFNPLVPLDVERSSLPAALFTFTLRNPGRFPVHAWLAAAVRNPVGGRNLVRRRHGWTSLVMDEPGLDPAAAGNGQAVLAADSPLTSVFPSWSEPAQFLRFLDSRAVFVGAPGPADWVADHQPSGTAPPGGPCGGLAVPAMLEPGQSATIRLCLAWYFPNRYADFVQFGPPDPRWGPTRFWLGNAYATRFADALDVADTVRTDWHELRSASLDWVGTLHDSSLPAHAAEHLAAQASILRSPSCFQSADGAFFGFEGVLGASTTMWSGDHGGSCPLNCTHVWNYAQAVARLFPSLERSMRATEFEVMQAPQGYLPHRVIVPTYLRQLWDVPIGGPGEPALDGMLGAILKTYREVRHGSDRSYLPQLERMLTHIRRTWDPDGTGVLRGIQPSTHDIDLTGVNPFMGTLWLAALRAAGELTGSDELRELFERGSAAYDEAMFNGEYFVQVLDEPVDFQWGEGCLSDQLIGQWWAHQLDLGHLLPAGHVRSALRAIVRHNLRKGFHGFEHPYRVFADGDDTGLLMCTWPRGGRPAVPTRYCDEVWTGSEYQVAAHCLWEGLEEEAWQILDGLWARYDGSRRNPYNQIECGDHYVRAMAGWSVVEALGGLSWDARSGALTVRRPGRWPLLLPSGWGQAVRDAGAVHVVCTAGAMDIRSVNGRRVAATLTAGETFSAALP